MALQPYTREAIRYGLSFNWISVGNSGGIHCIAKQTLINSAIRKLEGDAKECVSRARFLGKWFNTMASIETTMALWGIRP
jgi:hypothetical protein